jgi:hypothetical protein
MVCSEVMVAQEREAQPGPRTDQCRVTLPATNRYSIITVQALVPNPWHVNVYVRRAPNSGNTKLQSH